MTGFEEAYNNFVQTDGHVGTYIEVERKLLADFRQDNSPLAKRVENAYAKLGNLFHANEFPEGDSRRGRNLECYKMLHEKIMFMRQ